MSHVGALWGIELLRGLSVPETLAYYYVNALF